MSTKIPAGRNTNAPDWLSILAACPGLLDTRPARSPGRRRLGSAGRRRDVLRGRRGLARRPCRREQRGALEQRDADVAAPPREAGARQRLVVERPAEDGRGEGGRRGPADRRRRESQLAGAPPPTDRVALRVPGWRRPGPVGGAVNGRCTEREGPVKRIRSGIKRGSTCRLRRGTCPAPAPADAHRRPSRLSIGASRGSRGESAQECSSVRSLAGSFASDSTSHRYEGGSK